MTAELTYRKFTEKDLVKISEFRKSNFRYNSSLRSYEPEYYSWKCCQNPVLPGEMWLAEDGDKIVGIRNLTPKRMKVLEKVVNAAEVGDNFVHPDYQRRGIATKLIVAIRESMLGKGISLIYGVPGRITSIAEYMKKMNYAPVPIKLRTLVKPLDMKQLLKVKGHFPSPLAAFVSPVIKIISDIITRIGAMGSTLSDISISMASSFPDDIGVLWEEVSKHYDIMLVRTKDYLEWRYIKNPDTYSIMLAVNKAGTTVGYIVTKVGFYNGVPVGFIVDFLTLEDNKRIFRQLLLSAIKEFHQQKVSAILTWVVRGGFYARILSSFGFLPYGKSMVSCYQNELGSQVTDNYYKWHFTMGDTDNI